MAHNVLFAELQMFFFLQSANFMDILTRWFSDFQVVDFFSCCEFFGINQMVTVNHFISIEQSKKKNERVTSEKKIWTRNIKKIEERLPIDEDQCLAFRSRYKV